MTDREREMIMAAATWVGEGFVRVHTGRRDLETFLDHTRCRISRLHRGKQVIPPLKSWERGAGTRMSAK
jgi:hypothetical protein